MFSSAHLQHFSDSGSVGSLSSIAVFEPDHIIEMIGGNLEKAAIRHRDHSMKRARRHVKNGSLLEEMALEAVDIGSHDEFEIAIEHSQGFFLDLVILQAQRLTLADEEDLADIVLGLGENFFVSPGFIDNTRS
jgi:hypothetical protein